MATEVLGKVTPRVWNPFDRKSAQPKSQERVEKVVGDSGVRNPFAGGATRASLDEDKEVTVVEVTKKDRVASTLPVNPLGSGTIQAVILTPGSDDESSNGIVSNPTMPVEFVTPELRLKIGKLQSLGFDALVSLKNLEGRGTDQDRKMINNLHEKFDSARNAEQQSSTQATTMETLVKAMSLTLSDMDKRLTKPGVKALIRVLNQILSPEDGNTYTLQTGELLVKQQGGIRGGFRGVFRNVSTRTEEARTALVLKVHDLVHEDKLSRTPLEKKLVEKAEKVDAILQQHIEQS